MSAANDVETTSSELAVVTGAAGGIGRVIVHTLLDHGINVVAADIAHTPDTKSRYLERQAELLQLSVDISSESSVATLFDDCCQAFGRPPNILINNAGVQTWKSLLDLELAEWERTISTNLTGCFLMTRCFARHAIAGGMPGTIVNIGSGCNKLAFPNLVDYTASKGGIEMFTKSAASELGAHGIRVNCLAPGAIETARTQQESSDYAGSWAAITPLGRVGQPADVARAVLMLCGEAAGFISGQTINVDGGLFSRAIWPAE